VALLNSLLADVGILPLIALLVAAFCTSMVHGATGVAGGILLAAIAAPLLGVKAVVPVLSIALLISHSARAILNIKQFDKQAYLQLVFPAIPFIIIAALIYGQLSNAAIAFTLGFIVLLSIPIRRMANALKLSPTKPVVIAAGAIYGSLSGVSIGPGMLLLPVLLSMGLNRQAFVATLAAIALTTNIVRISVYGFSDLLSAQNLLLGVLVGLATIPGTWVGRGLLRRMTDEKHIVYVEWLIVLGALNFFWLAYKQL